MLVGWTVVYLVVGTEPAASLVVVDEELEPVAFVEAAFVRHGVHQDERFRPSDVRFQRETVGFLC